VGRKAKRRKTLGSVLHTQYPGAGVGLAAPPSLPIPFAFSACIARNKRTFVSNSDQTCDLLSKFIGILFSFPFLTVRCSTLGPSDPTWHHGRQPPLVRRGRPDAGGVEAEGELVEREETLARVCPPWQILRKVVSLGLERIEVSFSIFEETDRPQAARSATVSAITDSSATKSL
jgi:hypothetical protein